MTGHGSGRRRREAIALFVMIVAMMTGGLATSARAGEAAPNDAALFTHLDQAYALKGVNIHYPSEGDTLVRDAGGVRSALDRLGIGVLGFDDAFYAQNTLATPIKVPNTYAPNPVAGTVGAGNQVYVGQRPTFVNAAALTLFYDARRLGIPDGQIYVSGTKFDSTYQSLLPNRFAVAEAGYYQTLLGRKFELEFGLLQVGQRFIGTNIGGNFVSTYGPAASVHYLLGMAFIAAPAVDLRFNLTDEIYSKASVQRSAPVNGPTGNSIYDEAKSNPTDLRFSAPGEGVFAVDEVGYRNEAAPGRTQTWLRIGGMYNTSRFRDFSQLTSDPAATVKGGSGLYALADRQLVQTAPDFAATAYRGLYAGGTFEYGSPKIIAVSQYCEARLYVIGPFASRPTDLASLVYNHQTFSHFLADALNPISELATAGGVQVAAVRHASNATTLSYLAHLSPGAYLTTSIGYTDHPSTLYFQREGAALNVQAGLVTLY